MVKFEFIDTENEVYYIKVEAHSLEQAKNEEFSYVTARIRLKDDIIYLTYENSNWSIITDQGHYKTWEDFELADPKLAETVDNLMDEFFLKALK